MVCSIFFSGTTLLISQTAKKQYSQKDNWQELNISITGTDTINYIDLPGTFYTATDGGYVVGTNIYGDLGKYQRFDFDESVVSLLGVVAIFGEKGVVDTADNITFVTTGIGSNNAPENTLLSEIITTDDIDTLDYTTVMFDPPLNDPGSVFIGFEWTSAVDDSFGLISDVDGDGNGENRAWEKWSDGQYFPFTSSQSWELDVDLWLGAVVMTPTGVEIMHPAAFTLSQNYPNPFNPVTSINFQIPERGLVTIKVFDLLGNEIQTLLNEVKEMGSYSINFNAEDLSSGIYIYKISVNDYIASKKMILVK